MRRFPQHKRLQKYRRLRLCRNKGYIATVESVEKFRTIRGWRCRRVSPRDLANNAEFPLGMRTDISSSSARRVLDDSPFQPVAERPRGETDGYPTLLNSAGMCSASNTCGSKYLGRAPGKPAIQTMWKSFSAPLTGTPGRVGPTLNSTVTCVSLSLSRGCTYTPRLISSCVCLGCCQVRWSLAVVHVWPTLCVPTISLHPA